MNDGLMCEVCGKRAFDEYDLDIYHRGCRLKAAFPADTTTLPSGIIALDLSSLIAERNKKIVLTHDGVEFERWSNGRVSMSVHVQVGNTMSDWSWFITREEWEDIARVMTERADAAAPVESARTAVLSYAANSPETFVHLEEAVALFQREIEAAVRAEIDESER